MYKNWNLALYVNVYRLTGTKQSLTTYLFDITRVVWLVLVISYVDIKQLAFSDILGVGVVFFHKIPGHDFVIYFCR